MTGNFFLFQTPVEDDDSDVENNITLDINLLREERKSDSTQRSRISKQISYR